MFLNKFIQIDIDLICAAIVIAYKVYTIMKIFYLRKLNL